MVSVIETISTQRKAKLWYSEARKYLAAAQLQDDFGYKRDYEKMAASYQRNAAYLSAVDRRERGVE